MYIPKVNELTDKAEIVSFMKRFSFATIITSQNNIPTATHLPFIISETGEEVMLISHFAKANPQWQQLEACPVLVIFTEPHAYISPSNYESHLSVPTWNYIAVHAYGKAQLITDTASVSKVLESTIDFYEKEYKAQWHSFPEEYKLKLLNGIVAFRVEIERTEAKAKLSQNRSVADQQSIIEHLNNSGATNDQQIAEFMGRNLKV